ncbi:YceI family protein [Pelomonas sp. CA6]|uniref:YceI family protein n=1 Tax=Pelomonas sp. CA6 TaxID=2907999 RepID=UPI001F4C0A3E|nr:YceI family protein [Pelomonas sp. CA6]MCH7345668.1 YceI family protein [Pelomonas sp. CA6]
MTLKKPLLIVALLAAAAAQAEPANYMIDPTHTYATFEIPHFGTSTNRGRFEKKEGTVVLDRATKSGKVEITFQMNGISTGAAAFDKHLQSADFFDVANHPTAKFVGDKFSFDGDKVSEVAGQLTLKGKTAPVTLKATNFNCYQNPMLKREVCGGDFETTIDRTQWGVDYGLAYGFPKAVKLVIQVEAVRQ